MPYCCQISRWSYYYGGLIRVFQASSVILLGMDLIIAVRKQKYVFLLHDPQRWRLTLKALSSRVQYKYRNQPRWSSVRWLWSLFTHLILSSTHASAGDGCAMIVLGGETARVKTARGHYSYCIISRSGQSSNSSISVLMKTTTSNWQARLHVAEFT